MTVVISYILLGVAILLAIPCFVFFVEVAAAIFLPKQTMPQVSEESTRVAIIVPAHNESLHLAPTISDLKSQLNTQDRLIVVADNCSDDTSAVASSMGAEVTVRTDPRKIGKGYALDSGVQFLMSDPPDVVIFVDADCRLLPGTIDQLAAACRTTQRPIQALYLMELPDALAINHQVAQFAWRVKNLIRPLGLCSLGLPCQLVGTGMAFPWNIIQQAELSTNHLAEDIKLGLDLAADRKAPIFFPSAIVRSTFPHSIDATKSQRERWESGYFSILAKTVPYQLWTGIKQNNFELLALAIDLLIPPIALLVSLTALLVLVSGLAVLAGAPSIPLVVSSVSFSIMLLAIALSWVKVGREVLPLTSFTLIGPYLMLRMKFFGSIVSRRGTQKWIRTDRD